MGLVTYVVTQKFLQYKELIQWLWQGSGE